SFDALNEKAGTVPHGLGATEWWCEEGKLVTRAVIDTGPDSFGSGEHDESYVRLWKSPDGSLIAEGAVRAVRRGRFGTAVERQPLARSYIRFPEASPSGWGATRARPRAVLTSGPGRSQASATWILKPFSSARSCSSRSACSSALGGS